MAEPLYITMNPVKKYGSKCCFTGCGRSKHNFPDLHFFRFPIKKPQVLEQWLINCDNERLCSLSDSALYAKRVCGKHFSSDCFTNDLKFALKKDAIPTIPDPLVEELVDYQRPLIITSVGTAIGDFEDQSLAPAAGAGDVSDSPVTSQRTNSTNLSLESGALPLDSSSAQIPTQKIIWTPKAKTAPVYMSPKANAAPFYIKRGSVEHMVKRIQRLKKNVNMFRARLSRLAARKKKLTKEELAESMDDYFPPEVSKFFKMQLNHAKPTKKPWSDEEMRFAFAISQEFPSFYEKMKKDGFKFPGRSTLSRWLQRVDLKPEMKLKIERDGKFKNKSYNGVPSIEQYCRVCGLEAPIERLIHIFRKEGCDLSLEKKILEHLHLQVSENDQLPQQVCLSCASNLNTCQQFMEACHTADYKLQKLFLKSDVVEDEMQNLAGDVEVWEDSQQQKSNDDGESSENNNKETAASEGQESGKSVLCHVCGKAFKSVRNLYCHKRTHLSRNLKYRFQCSLCVKAFRTNFHLSEHMNRHLGRTPYTCQTCDKQFSSRALLRQHLQVHSQDKIQCPKCNLQCSRKSNLAAHMRIHGEGRTFRCRLCHQQFPTFSEMLVHRRQHSKDEDNLFSCHLCDKVYTAKRTLQDHVDRVHGDNSAAVKCEDCGKVLSSAHSLEYHRRSQHSGERPYQCSYCGKGFLQHKLLEAHEAKHTGDRPFKCDTCGKGFMSRNNMLQHALKHTEDKKFECAICGKNFLRRGALAVHQRIHSGEKLVICDVCGRGFTRRNDLNNHQRTHGVTPYNHSCGECMFVFPTKKELTKHKQEAHGAQTDVPLIVTNNLYETHVITEDGQQLIFPAVSVAFEESHEEAFEEIVISDVPVT